MNAVLVMQIIERIQPCLLYTSRRELRAACSVRRMNDEAEFLPRPVKTGRKVTAAARAAQKLRRELEDAPLIGRVRLSLRPVNAALRYEHKIPRLEQILLALHAIARFSAKKFNDLVECVICLLYTSRCV